MTPDTSDELVIKWRSTTHGMIGGGNDSEGMRSASTSIFSSSLSELGDRDCDSGTALPNRRLSI